MKTTGRDQVVTAMVAFMLLEREKRLKKQKQIEATQTKDDRKIEEKDHED